MNFSLLRFYSLAVIAIVAIIIGCKTPPEPPAQTKLPLRSKYSVHYDTEYEKFFTGDKPASPLITSAWKPYVNTLAEPVAIIDWQPTHATWEVFVATNRKPVESTKTNSVVKFGKGQLKTPVYTRALVQVPRRKRGEDPKMPEAKPEETETEKPWYSFASLGKKSEPEETVDFESNTFQSPNKFFAGITRQVEESRQKDLLLFVHGFNVSYDAAVVRTAQIAMDTPFNGAVVCYSWPSQGGLFNYSNDEPINADAVEPFTQFLTELIRNVPPETRINIVVHSMGNRIVMKAINRLPEPPAGEKLLRNVVLCAPDVGITQYKAWVRGIVRRAERVTLYTCSLDTALAASKGLHNEQRAGDADPPTIVDGVELIDCTSMDFSFMGHSYYGNNISVLSDLFNIIKEQKPAAERSHLAEVKTEQGSYWKFDFAPPTILWTWHFDVSTHWINTEKSPTDTAKSVTPVSSAKP